MPGTRPPGHWALVVYNVPVVSGPLPAVGPSRPRIDRRADTHNADTPNAPDTEDYYEVFTDFSDFLWETMLSQSGR